MMLRRVCPLLISPVERSSVQKNDVSATMVWSVKSISSDSSEAEGMSVIPNPFMPLGVTSSRPLKRVSYSLGFFRAANIPNLPNVFSTDMYSSSGLKTTCVCPVRVSPSKS